MCIRDRYMGTECIFPTRRESFLNHNLSIDARSYFRGELPSYQEKLLFLIIQPLPKNYKAIVDLFTYTDCSAFVSASNQPSGIKTPEGSRQTLIQTPQDGKRSEKQEQNSKMIDAKRERIEQTFTKIKDYVNVVISAWYSKSTLLEELEINVLFRLLLKAFNQFESEVIAVEKLSLIHI
eukprot:TRINITY_DN5428_c0_g1_i6.p1 TRINITY_DN5428_c0_g1~~TRINITY_DN5428_c0_g1_i6.p1  ORF type:complete len:179 (-),score=20.61 TRINITY_DN5428_c0_g1_i6:61-597(-)